MSKELNKYLHAYTGDNIYDFDNNILLNWYSKRIIELTNSNESLLELGLGHGFTALNFSKFFKKLDHSGISYITTLHKVFP